MIKKQALTLLDSLNYKVAELKDHEYKLALALTTYFRENRIFEETEKEKDKNI